MREGRSVRQTRRTESVCLRETPERTRFEARWRGEQCQLSGVVGAGVYVNPAVAGYLAPRVGGRSLAVQPRWSSRATSLQRARAACSWAMRDEDTSRPGDSFRLEAWKALGGQALGVSSEETAGCRSTLPGARPDRIPDLGADLRQAADAEVLEAAPLPATGLGSSTSSSGAKPRPKLSLERPFRSKCQRERLWRLRHWKPIQWIGSHGAPPSLDAGMSSAILVGTLMMEVARSGCVGVA